MLIPLKSSQSRAGYPFATWALMLANLAAYCFIARGWLMPQSLLQFYELTPEKCDFERILVGLFLHNNLFQVLFGVWCLALFGVPLELHIKAPKFLLIYFVSGFAGSFLRMELLESHPEAGRLFGSSSAIMGVVGACIYCLPYARIEVWYWWGIFRSRYAGGWGFSDSRGYDYDMFGRHDPLNDSGEWNWPIWAVAAYMAIPDFVLTLLVSSPATYLTVLACVPLGIAIPWVIRQKKENSAVNEARVTFSETQDLGLLSPEELEALWHDSPDDTTVLLNWMYKSMQSHWGVTQTCLEAFQRRLAAIVEQQPPESVAGILAAMNKHGQHVESKYLVYVGGKLEAKKQNQLAIDAYESVRRDPNADADDAAAALFRLGVLYEKQLYNAYGAAQYYQEILDRFPLGAFASQAKARMAVIGARRPSAGFKP